MTAIWKTHAFVRSSRLAWVNLTVGDFSLILLLGCRNDPVGDSAYTLRHFADLGFSRRHIGLASGLAPLKRPNRYDGGGTGVRPCRRMSSPIFAQSRGPPAAALINSAAPRKYSGPIAAGVTTVTPFTSSIPLLSNR